MKKVIVTAVAMAFAITTTMANTPMINKKAKSKQVTCTSCPKGQKCSKETCPDAASCCK